MKNKGMTLFELTVALGITSVMFTFACLCGKGFIQNAKADSALNSLNAVYLASKEYYLRNNAWPTDISVLKPDYLKGIDFVNQFGQGYTLTPNGNRIDVSTLIPKGALSKSLIGPQAMIINEGVFDRVTFSTPIQNGDLTRLKYEKKYTYNQ